MKNTRMLLLSVLFGFLLIVPCVFGDEGRIPLSQPALSTQSLVITAPGSYVLTENLAIGDASTDPSAIVIQASDVTLDLNGRTVEVTAGDGAGILIDGDHRDIRIRNGRLRGGFYGVFYDSSLATTLWLEGLDISDVAREGVSAVQVMYAEVVRCKVRNTANGGIFLQGSDGFTGRIVGNEFSTIANTAIIVLGGHGVVVRSNTLLNVYRGIYVAPPCCAQEGAVLIEDNSMVYDPSVSVGGVGIGVTAPGCQVINNVIRGFPYGINFDSPTRGGRIAGNVVTGGAGPGDGIFVDDTSRNLVEGNQIQGNAGCGLRFAAGSADNAYRNNMIRGNTGGAVCNAGAGNTDAGGNIL